MARAPVRPPSANAFEVHISAGQTIDFLRLGGRTLEYGTVNAINASAIAAQKAVVAGVRTRFTVRKPDFTTRQAAIISPFANVAGRRYYATVRVGEKPRFFLSVFEAGGDRPHAPGRLIAAAVTGGPARPSFGTAQAWPPLIRRLGLRRPRRKSGTATSRRRRPPAPASGGGSLQGEQHTFATREGVFQRVGHSVRAIYLFLKRARLRPRLGFDRTARAAVAASWPRAIDQEIRAAFEHRSRRGR